MKKTDAVIIGFGKGGKTLAGALANAGKKVILIEKSDKMYGGTCINVACIPTKSLVHSASLSAAAGGTFDEKARRYEAAIEEKTRLTAMLRDKNYHKLADNPNITVLNAAAAFTSPQSVHADLADGGSEDIEAAQFFVNTGARPFVPDIPGLRDSHRVYLSETMLELKKLPEHLAIIGGGYIGVEFASMYANFGSEITVIQDGEAFLPREDAEIAQAVLNSLEARGVKIIRSAKTTGIRDTDNAAVLSVETPQGKTEITAEAVLVAAGRRPNIDFAPEKAGIELTPRGAVKVDEHLKTSVNNIYAMGDVAGGLQFTYISLDDFRIVSSAVLGDGSRTTLNRGAVPYSVFLDPPFSRVGLTEQEAIDKGYSVKTARLPAAAIPKAQVLRKPVGLLKAVIDANTGKILGAHIFCEESHEIINLLKLAIDAGIPYTVLRDSIYTHPTMSEGLNDLFAAVR